MRWTIYTLTVLCALAITAHAGQPTKTLTQGGWFAFAGGLNQDPSTFCGGSPCTDENFAAAFGSQLKNTFPSGPPQATLLYHSRAAAENALQNNDFSIFPVFCDPEGTGSTTTTMFTGYVKYAGLEDFSLATLRDSSILQDGMFWAFEYIQAVQTYAQFTGTDSLMGDPQNFIDPETGFSVQSGSRPFAFMQLDQMLYDAMRKWAKANGFVIDFLNVERLQTKTIDCPL